MKHQIRIAAGVTTAAVLAVAAIAWAAPQVHQPPLSAHQAPDKSDPRVGQLYAMLKTAHGQGEKHDREALTRQVKALAADYARETGADAAVMEAHVLEISHKLLMQAQSHPEVLASLDSFWDAMHAAGGQ